MSIEQAIGDVAVQLAGRLSANSSPEEAVQWKDAARALRFPYVFPVCRCSFQIGRAHV